MTPIDSVYTLLERAVDRLRQAAEITPCRCVSNAIMATEAAMKLHDREGRQKSETNTSLASLAVAGMIYQLDLAGIPPSRAELINLLGMLDG